MKITLFFLIAILYLNNGAMAQGSKKNDQSKMLDIGDKVPDLEFKNVYNYHNGSLNLADFKGKAIILDFWATWCGACLHHMPHMLEVQRKYAGKLQVLTVNNDDNLEKLTAFFNKKKGTKLDITVPVLHLEKQLDTLFPHKVIPHYVWIGPDRRLKAITLPDQVTDENVKRLIAGLDLYVTQKKR